MGRFTWQNRKGKSMKINWIGNFGNGYVGELGDSNHLVRELEALGHTVQKVPEDVWKAFVDGETGDWVLPEIADINIICKWHHFNDRKYINKLKEVSNAPVFYWVWDFMYDGGFPDWHLKMVQACDLYLGNDVRDPHYDTFKNVYYFPFDVSDGEIKPNNEHLDEIYDIVFFGSWIGQGNRQEWLTEINRTNPITVFSWNFKDFPKEFKVHEAVYGEEFNKAVAQSKIVLGFSVEANTWGYWSNRVGKVLNAGGFLLYQYAPGMELFLRDGVEYFSSIDEACEKIDYYLIAEFERRKIAKRGHKLGRFTSKERIKDLVILIERFLKKEVVWQL